MYKPPITASTAVHIVFVRFAERRCGRAGHNDLAEKLKSANLELLAKTRAVEDAEYPQFDAIGDRDEVGGDLLQTVRNLRAQLLARDSEAGNEGIDALMSKVLPDGMVPFDSIKLGEYKVLYGLIVKQLEDALPREDELR